MAIHHCLGGAADGLSVWANWAATGNKFKKNGSHTRIEKRWHSFGKTVNPVGYGTLLHYANEGGYCEPVTFVYDGSLGTVEDLDSGNNLESNLDSVKNDKEPKVKSVLDEPVDLKRPPDFVGSLTEWINSQCLYPRENLAVDCALTAVSSLSGMRYTDELDGITPNLLSFCVAGSGTGKEQIMQCYLNIAKAYLLTDNNQNQATA